MAALAQKYVAKSGMMNESHQQQQNQELSGSLQPLDKALCNERQEVQPTSYSLMDRAGSTVSRRLYNKTDLQCGSGSIPSPSSSPGQ